MSVFLFRIDVEKGPVNNRFEYDCPVEFSSYNEAFEAANQYFRDVMLSPPGDWPAEYTVMIHEYNDEKTGRKLIESRGEHITFEY